MLVIFLSSVFSCCCCCFFFFCYSVINKDSYVSSFPSAHDYPWRERKTELQHLARSGVSTGWLQWPRADCASAAVEKPEIRRENDCRKELLIIRTGPIVCAVRCYLFAFIYSALQCLFSPSFADCWLFIETVQEAPTWFISIYSPLITARRGRTLQCWIYEQLLFLVWNTNETFLSSIFQRWTQIEPMLCECRTSMCIEEEWRYPS